MTWWNCTSTDAIQQDARQILGDLRMRRMRRAQYRAPFVIVLDEEEIAIVLQHLPHPNQIPGLYRVKEENPFDASTWLRPEPAIVGLGNEAAFGGRVSFACR